VIVGHGMQGISGATMPLCLGLLRQWMPRDKIPLWVGVLMGSFAAAAMIGYVVGGALAQFVHWRWLFAVGAAMALVGLVAVMLVIPKSRPAGRAARLDIVGGAVFVPAVAGLLVTLTNGRAWGWTSPMTLAVGGAALASIAYWVWHELHSPNPLINLRLLRDRSIACANLAQIAYGVGTVQLSFLFMLLLQQPAWTGIGFGMGATMAAVLKIPSNMVAIFSAPLNGHMAGRRGTRFAMIVAFAVSVAGWAMVCLAPKVLVIVILSSAAIGFSNSAALAAISNVIVAAVPEDRVSEVLGMSVVIRQVANAAGTLALSALLQMRPFIAPDGTGRHFPSLEAFVTTFAVVAGCSIFGVAIGLALPHGKQARCPVDDPGCSPGRDHHVPG
jgi:MFS family permease